MELFKNVRLKIGKRMLSNKLSRTKRKVFYSNISLVKNIGIVWDASKPEEFQALSRFHQKMNERSIEIDILGYFPGKELPNQYTAIRYLTCLRKKDINFFYHPLSNDSSKFMSKKFDILIDINFKNLFPLQYISTMSDANLKTGLYDSESTELPFDLMMEIKKPVDIDIYLDLIMHYLEIINSGTSKN
jgi:hypothetical protein